MSDHRVNLPWQGLERRALLHVPPGVGPRPLVVALHGTGGSSRLMASITGLSRLAGHHGFLVAYPQALGEPGPEEPARGAAWNAGPGLGCPAFADADDVGFLRALITRVSAEHDVDPARIHLCGLSNGGRMAYRMALEAPDLLASIAVVAGAWNGVGERRGRPVSTLILHGTDDTYIPYLGGVGTKGRAVPQDPAPETALRWGRIMGCGGRPKRRVQEPFFSDTLTEGPTEVTFWTLPGEGHTWPGGRPWSPTADRPTTALSASSLILDFFDRHPLERA
ncbi:MAG TPA: PHB depolymerase family esterase [Holophagaceae bacterium]|nr:PHB depolymerase family esterase [Holophagaceae bacterium]